MCVVTARARARYRLWGVVHYGRTFGTPDGVDIVVPLCEERVFKPFRRLWGPALSVVVPVDCMACLVEEARRSVL